MARDSSLAVASISRISFFTLPSAASALSFPGALKTKWSANTSGIMSVGRVLHAVISKSHISILNLSSAAPTALCRSRPTSALGVHQTGEPGASRDSMYPAASRARRTTGQSRPDCDAFFLISDTARPPPSSVSSSQLPAYDRSRFSFLERRTHRRGAYVRRLTFFGIFIFIIVRPSSRLLSLRPHRHSRRPLQ